MTEHTNCERALMALKFLYRYLEQTQNPTDFFVYLVFYNFLKVSRLGHFLYRYLFNKKNGISTAFFSWTFKFKRNGAHPLLRCTEKIYFLTQEIVSHKRSPGVQRHAFSLISSQNRKTY